MFPSTYFKSLLIYDFLCLVIIKLHEVTSTLDHGIWGNLTVFVSNDHSFLAPEEIILYPL